MKEIRKIYYNIGIVEPKEFVSATVVSAHCCTYDVLEHMKVAALTDHEMLVLQRFKDADRNLLNSISRFQDNFDVMEKFLKTVLTDDDLSRARSSLYETAYIVNQRLPRLICLDHEYDE